MIYVLIIALMAAGDLIMWQAIRSFERRGSVFVGLGFVQRDASPRWFCLHMAMWWIGLGLGVALTLVVGFLFMAAGIDASN
jgi:hypothetical protein